MGTQKALRRAASLLASGSLVAAVSCLGPTEVTLALTTDIPCSAQHGTSIAVGDPSDVATSAPVTVTSDCTLTGDGVEDGGALAVPADIGSLVVVPSGSRSASFVVQVVTAVDPVAQPSDCTAPAYQGCIVARRQISFIPHTPLTLPIEITLDCLNVLCSESETCYHAHCVTVNTVCSGGACTPAISTPDASSSPDDVTTEEAGFDATAGMPDALAVEEAPPTDGPTVVVEEASAVDSAATDGSSEVGLQDAPIEDAPRESGEDAAPEASIHDAASETATGESDASEASAPPTDGGVASDAGPLGSCIDAGASTGVECGGTLCLSGQVCCVAFDPGGGTTKACTALGSCDYNGAGSTTYTALGCLNIGDCRSGQVCCASASTTGSGSITQCTTSCPYMGFGKQSTACENSCECPSGQPQCNAETCLGYTIGLCGASGGSTCP